MRLRDFQAGLGQALCYPAATRGAVALATLLDSPGFAFTREVQRSWCEGRVAAMARATLDALPPERARELSQTWVDRGGGRDTFAPDEAVRFLDYLGERVADDPHLAELCAIERAIRLAAGGMPTLVRPQKPHADALLRRGEWTTLLNLGDPPGAMFFAPGLPQLCREATAIERRLWHALVAPAAMANLAHLEADAVVSDLLAAGIVEVADAGS